MKGRIRPRRPRTRWLREVNKDARVLGIRLCLSFTLDGDEWSRLLMKARTLGEV